MNNQVITKIISSNDVNGCPEFVNENPLIDRNVAGALTRSFIKILRVSQQDTNINNNLRYSVLANIRKLCRTEPENHLEVDENFTKSLTELYMNSVRSSQENDTTSCVERFLDEFLVRRIKEVDINSNYQHLINPEVIQALLNLTEDHTYVESVSRDVLHWNISDKKHLALVKNLWTNPSLNTNINNNIYDDLAIKMSPEIEAILLNSCHCILTEPNLQAEELFTKDNLKNLVFKCSKSPKCFQICTGILNYLFVHTNYNVDIKLFISYFIKYVKTNCLNSFSVMYPTHLSSLVVLLDIDFETLQETFKSKYVAKTAIYLKELQKESHNDLVLLLSHFPQWFSIYFKENNYVVTKIKILL